MKQSKAVNVTNRQLEYQLFEGASSFVHKCRRMNDVGVQYNRSKDNICTCRKLSGIKRHHETRSRRRIPRYFSTTPRQIYTYHSTRSFTEIGVGSIKALQKKKVKRVYLPETDDRGVGSSVLTGVINQSRRLIHDRGGGVPYSFHERGAGIPFSLGRSRYSRGFSYFEEKKTSSKCVGGVLENTVECLVSAKISPIVNTRSESTSPVDFISEEKKKNVEMGSNTEGKELVATTTQIETPVSVSKAVIEIPILEIIKPIIKSAQSSKRSTLDRKSTLEKKSTIEKKSVHEKKSTLEKKSLEKKSTLEKKSMLEKKSTLEKKSNLEKKSTLEKKSILSKKSVISIDRRSNMEKKSFSSDSLVQHVHNLENPSEYKPTSIDPMENKLEREYLKMFVSKSKEAKQEVVSEKPIPEKSTSLFRRRFTALRRSLGKKDSKNMASVRSSSDASVPSVRDVSITSDPPSLEGRSYSNTFPSQDPITTGMAKPIDGMIFKKSYSGKKKTGSFSSAWSRANTIDSEYATGVKGMFKLWGKKFNLDESGYRKDSPNSSVEDTNSPRTEDIEIILPEPEIAKIVITSPEKSSVKSDDKSSKTEKEKEKDKIKDKDRNKEKDRDKDKDSSLSSKKEGKKFFFFKKKQPKEKQPPPTKPPSYKTKKNITTGRCELRDGLTIKIGPPAAPEPAPKKSLINQITDNYEMLRANWLMKYLRTPTESRKSVQIRWNNKTYTTSSSTVFELMDMYKTNHIVLRSRSDTSTGESSSYYREHNKKNVNFVQHVQAWMVPNIIPDRPPPVVLRSSTSKYKNDGKNIEVTISNQKWFIDKSKPFSHKILVVLHSSNFAKLQNPRKSSDYVRIPKDFFFDTSSDESPPAQTSDEEVYKIVEYETSKSSTDFRIVSKYLQTGCEPQDIEVTISVKDAYQESKILETMIKKPPTHRDVVTQGSNVYVPKMCDVIGVGIITPWDVRKPNLRVLEYLTDDESSRSFRVKKQCDFAESYLQDYYKNMDLFSWCYSDSHLSCCTEADSRNNNGDASKSCPNIYDDYLTMVSSGGASCCNEAAEEPKGGFLKTKKTEPNYYRILPKDSLEVFKKRKVYAIEKSRWVEDCCQPVSIPSNDDRGVQSNWSSHKPPKERPYPRKEDQNVSGILIFGGCRRDTPGPKNLRLKPEPSEIPYLIQKPEFPEEPDYPKQEISVRRWSLKNPFSKQESPKMSPMIYNDSYTSPRDSPHLSPTLRRSPPTSKKGPKTEEKLSPCMKRNCPNHESCEIMNLCPPPKNNKMEQECSPPMDRSETTREDLCADSNKGRTKIPSHFCQTPAEPIGKPKDSKDSCEKPDPCDKPCDKPKDAFAKLKETLCKTQEDPCDKPKDPCDKPKDPCDKPKDTCDKPKDTCDTPKDPCDTPKDSCDKSKDACDKPKDPCDKPKDPCEKPKECCKTSKESCKKPKDPCCKPKDPCDKPKSPCDSPKDSSCSENSKNTCDEPKENCPKDPCDKPKDPCDEPDPCDSAKDSCASSKDSCGEPDPCEKKVPCGDAPKKTRFM